MTDPRNDDLSDVDAFDEDAFDDVIDDEVDDVAYTDTARSEAVTVDSYSPPATTVVKRGTGLPLVLLTGIVAAVAGAVGGYGLASTFPPVAPVTDDIAELRAELAGLDASDRLARLSARVEAVEARRVPRVDLSPLEARLRELESRPDSVLPDADDVADNTGNVEAEDNAPSRPAPALTPALARRLSTLERRVAAVEAELERAPEAAEPTMAPTRAQPATAQPTAARPARTRVEDLPPYPFAAVEAAISAEEPSTFRRILKVRDRSTVDALADLRAALESYDIKAALAAHARLPDAAQTEAADWARRASALR